MKRFTFLFVLCACLFAWSVTGNVSAQTPVVVDFEEFADEINEDGEDHDSAYGWSWNGTDDRYYSGWFPEYFGTWNGLAPGPYGIIANELAYQSEGVTFYILPGSDSGMNFWFGTGLSTVTNTTFASYLNEMASITGSGAGGSATYAVVYGDSTIDLDYDSPYNPRISLPPGATIKSIAITNTVYTYSCLTDTDPFGFATPLSQNGDFFNLIIHGVRSDGTLVNSITVPLGSYENDTLSVLTNWATIDLCSLAGSAELRFSFDGNDIGYGLWLNQPVYFAFDNLIYIPAVP
jgi:hypothetical protein